MRGGLGGGRSPRPRRARCGRGGPANRARAPSRRSAPPAPRGSRRTPCPPGGYRAGHAPSFAGQSALVSPVRSQPCFRRHSGPHMRSDFSLPGGVLPDGGVAVPGNGASPCRAVRAHAIQRGLAPPGSPGAGSPPVPVRRSRRRRSRDKRELVILHFTPTPDAAWPIAEIHTTVLPTDRANLAGGQPPAPHRRTAPTAQGVRRSRTGPRRLLLRGGRLLARPGRPRQPGRRRSRGAPPGPLNRWCRRRRWPSPR